MLLLGAFPCGKTLARWRNRVATASFWCAAARTIRPCFVRCMTLNAAFVAGFSRQDVASQCIQCKWYLRFTTATGRHEDAAASRVVERPARQPLGTNGAQGLVLRGLLSFRRQAVASSDRLSPKLAIDHRRVRFWPDCESRRSTQCRQSNVRKNRSHATVTIAQNCDLPDSRQFGDAAAHSCIARRHLRRHLQRQRVYKTGLPLQYRQPSRSFAVRICPHAFMPSALTSQRFMWEPLSMPQIRLCLAEVASTVQSIARQVQTLCMNAGCSEAARLAMQR